jgi:hypothetical protein
MILSAGVVALVAVGTFGLWPRPDRVTRENFGRLKPRMIQSEVYAIFGPPGDYTTGPIVEGGITERTTDDTCTLVVWPIPHFPLPICEVWETDGAQMEVMYSASGELMFSYWISQDKTSQSPLEDLLWRTKRQWRKWFPKK